MLCVRSVRSACVAALVGLAGFTWGPQLSAQTAATPAGFTASLFDGATLQGWTVEGDCKVTVENKLLVLKEGNGWLRSDHQYGDFILSLEWKALQAKEYDSGIYVRTLVGGKPFPKESHQVNLLQGKEGNVGNIPGAESKGLIKEGEWNRFDITCIGETISMKINGKDAYKMAGLKRPRGHVGFQCEEPKGGQFQFRNIQITELTHRPLFNGKDLTGWEGVGSKAEDCWKVEDGLLICTGAKGPWIRTAEEFGDFNLRIDYQVSSGGNSGVYVRVPANGNHHRENESAPPAGFEVQMLDDAHPKHQKLKDYQYSASVYDIAGAKQRVSKPAGEWNTLEINCHGQHVTTIHNGVVVVDAAEAEFPLLKLRQVKGFLGLQNHSTLVKFRNVRIGPAAAPAVAAAAPAAK